MVNLKFFVLILLFFQINCANSNRSADWQSANDRNADWHSTNTDDQEKSKPTGDKARAEQNSIQVGAARTAEYLPLLQDQTVALVVNQTSTIGNTHLADSLLSLEIGRASCRER